MRRKALILGALPQPQEGPWVSIEDADRWRVTPELGQASSLQLIVEGANGDQQVLTLDLPTDFSGKRARVVILDGIEGGPSITVVATEVRNGST